MWAKFCGFLLRILGWTTDGGPMKEDKAIVLGVPHTSAWDFVISYLFYAQFGRSAKVMVKKEFFIGPIGWLLRKMGGTPVDRSNATAMLKSLIAEMEKEKIFHLAIAPEGTRKPIKRWKTGFHLIARHVGCPVYLGYFDWGTKHVGVGKKFELSDNPKEDMKKIQAEYEKMGIKGKHPEKYITH